MTIRALATKLKRLENRTKRRPGWNDSADSTPPVVLPPVEEFRVQPLDEQKRLLASGRPLPSGTKLPRLEELKKLPVQEKIRLMAELVGPPDLHFHACFHCLPFERADQYMSRRHGWQPPSLGCRADTSTLCTPNGQNVSGHFASWNSAFNVLRVCREIAGQSPDFGRNQPADAAQDHCRKQHDQHNRGQSPQATALEDRGERGQQRRQKDRQRYRDEYRLRPIQAAYYHYADDRAGQNNQSPLPTGRYRYLCHAIRPPEQRAKTEQPSAKPLTNAGASNKAG
jgi:hypothetical protein